MIKHEKSMWRWFKTYSYHISYFTYLQSTTSAIAIARSWPESPVCFLRPTALQLLWRITSSTSISFMVLPSYRVGLQHSLYILYVYHVLSIITRYIAFYTHIHIYIYDYIYVCVCVHSLHYDIFTIKIDDGSWMYYRMT
jgi:hypothetical protein